MVLLALTNEVGSHGVGQALRTPRGLEVQASILLAEDGFRRGVGPAGFVGSVVQLVRGARAYENLMFLAGRIVAALGQVRPELLAPQVIGRADVVLDFGGGPHPVVIAGKQDHGQADLVQVGFA